MVFLECAMFVRNLYTQATTPPWVQHNFDSPHMRNVTANLRKWAEAIGEKLRMVELREKEMFVRLQSQSDPGTPLVLSRETVFLDEISATPPGDTAGRCISYALKMAACNLLLEITRFLRDIPPHFSPVAPASQVGTPLLSTHSFERAFSRTASNGSMDSLDAAADAGSHQQQTQHRRGASGDFKPPSLGQFGSTLSVEDAEPPPPPPPPEFPHQSFSMDEYAASSSLHRKRASFYLLINTSGNNPGGGSLSRTLSRNTSFKKPQSRVVRVAETPTESRTLSRALTHGSPSFRARRMSLSSAGHPSAPHRPSILVPANPTFLSASQPHYAMFAPTTGPGTNYLSRRRKSVGAVLLSQRSQESEYLPPPPSTPHTPGAFFSGKTNVGGGATSLGNSLNIGFTKLKRSAQRAFRRHGTKTRNASDLSPNASPGPLHRNKSPRQSNADNYSQKSTYYSSLTEESWRYYPWLDTLEHLVLVDTREASIRNKQECLKLVTALKKVYSQTYQEEEENVDRGKTKKDLTASRKHSTIGNLFIHHLALHDNLQPVDEQSSSGSYGRFQSLPAGGTGKDKRAGLQQTYRSISVPAVRSYRGQAKLSTLGKLSFAGWNSSKFVGTFLGRRESCMPNEETIQLTIEAESPYERTHLATQRDKERVDYLNSEFSGLVHVPFSILVYAAPILHASTFSVLKGVAWDALISTDEGLAQAAAAFFLLACAKEPEKAIKGFVTTKVLNRGALEQRWAVLRFKVLWDCRYGVWPRMQERAQKLLNLNEKDDKKEVRK